MSEASERRERCHRCCGLGRVPLLMVCPRCDGTGREPDAALATGRAGG